MYELDIALRHITARKRHTIFAVISVALAAGVIVVLMSMMSGFTEELVRVTVESSPHIVVGSQNLGDEYLHFSSYYSGLIAEIDGVEAVMLGTVGVVFGCIIDYAAAIVIGSYRIDLPSEVDYGLTTLPIKIDALNFVYAGVFSFIINAITGAYPALKHLLLIP